MFAHSLLTFVRIVQEAWGRFERAFPTKADVLWCEAASKGLHNCLFPGTAWTSAYIGGGHAKGVHKDTNVFDSDVLLYMASDRGARMEQSGGGLGLGFLCARGGQVRVDDGTLVCLLDGFHACPHWGEAAGQKRVVLSFFMDSRVHSNNTQTVTLLDLIKTAQRKAGVEPVVVEGRTCGRGAIGEVGKPPATANPNARKRKPGQRGPDKIAKKRRRRHCGVCKRAGCPGSGERALCNYKGANKEGKRAAGKQIANKKKP